MKTIDGVGKIIYTQFYSLRFDYDILLSLEMERTTPVVN